MGTGGHGDGRGSRLLFCPLQSEWASVSRDGVWSACELGHPVGLFAASLRAGGHAGRCGGGGCWSPPGGPGSVGVRVGLGLEVWSPPVRVPRRYGLWGAAPNPSPLPWWSTRWDSGLSRSTAGLRSLERQRHWVQGPAHSCPRDVTLGPFLLLCCIYSPHSGNSGSEGGGNGLRKVPRAP